MQPIENARPLLLGNIANLFLDEWIHAPNEDIDYRTCMQKAFRRYPIELAACPDLRDREKERQFFDDCKLHFEHIRETVNDTFHTAGYELTRRMRCLNLLISAKRSGCKVALIICNGICPPSSK